MRPENTASFEEMPLRWGAVGNNVSDLNHRLFAPETKAESLSTLNNKQQAITSRFILESLFSALEVERRK